MKYLIHLIFMVNQHQMILEQVNLISIFYIQFNFFILDDNNFFLSNHYPAATTSSSFHTDPFGMNIQPKRETNSPLNMFSSPLINTTNNLFAQSQPQLIPTRISAPIPSNSASQSPLSMKKLSLNPTNKKTETVTDLLDFNDPIPPPESPKFDPYA